MNNKPLEDLRTYLSALFVERQEVIEGMLTALVARCHVLLIGPPGTAKSALVVAMVRCITGAQYFQRLLTKFSTPEELFGPYDLARLKAGSYERITTGQLPAAHVAYLDEIFKANSAILNALLNLINERTFDNGGRVERSPLMALFGTSNEFPEEPELQAVFDRFLLRYEPGYVQEASAFQRMLGQGTSAAQPSISLSDIAVLQQEAQQIPLDSETVEGLTELRNDLMQAGHIVSDRRWMQVAHSLLPARAVLAGRDRIVLEDDGEILVHCLWDDPANRSDIASIVRRRIDPVSGQLVELLEDARDAAKAALSASEDDAPAAGMEAVKKIKATRRRVTEIHSSKTQAVDAECERLLAEVMDKCLGLGD